MGVRSFFAESFWSAGKRELAIGQDDTMKFFPWSQCCPRFECGFWRGTGICPWILGSRGDETARSYQDWGVDTTDEGDEEVTFVNIMSSDTVLANAESEAFAFAVALMQAKHSIKLLRRVLSTHLNCLRVILRFSFSLVLFVGIFKWPNIFSIS